MLEEIIKYLNSKISELKIIEKTEELAELVTDGERVFPAIFCKNGEYDYINFDAYNGLCFHMINGDITREQLENPISPKEFEIAVNFPMKLVAVVNRRILNDDDKYSASKFAELLALKLTNKDDLQLRTDIWGDAGKGDYFLLNVETFAVSIQMNRQTILSELFQESNIVDIDYKYALFTLDYNIEAIHSSSCTIEYLCNN